MDKKLQSNILTVLSGSLSNQIISYIIFNSFGLIMTLKKNRNITVQLPVHCLFSYFNLKLRMTCFGIYFIFYLLELWAGHSFYFRLIFTIGDLK